MQANITAFSREFIFRIVLFLTMSLIVYSYFMVFAEMALATDNSISLDSVSLVVCNAVYYITSGIGKAVAVLCVVFLGVGLFFGKTNWGLAFSVCLGIACIFGAAHVVKIIIGDDSVTNCGKSSKKVF